MVKKSARTAAFVVALGIISGCTMTSTASQQVDNLESVNENPKIILMPPDIRYYLLTAGGVAEPHAEWTEAAKKNFTVAVSDFADSIGTDLKIIDEKDLSQAEIAYEELHSAVGYTILANHFGINKLPTKGETFDWTLGPDISSIADDHDADYALFVFYRDEQASGGRVAMAVLSAALYGYTDTGSENGFASLVDLRTGDIVWFNVVHDGGGELRDPEGAHAAVKTLFKDIPQAGGQ